MIQTADVILVYIKLFYVFGCCMYVTVKFLQDFTCHYFVIRSMRLLSGTVCSMSERQ